VILSESKVASLYKIFELPWVYQLSQWVAEPTCRIYRNLAEEHFNVSSEQQVLEVGCGLGGFSQNLSCKYTGIDINLRYIDFAKRHFVGQFKQMDALNLNFDDSNFSTAYSIATFHHLSDQEILKILSEVFRVVENGKTFHLIDNVWPVNKRNKFKHAYFRADRGNHQRTIQAYEKLFNQCAVIEYSIVQSSVLHDVAYFRLRAS
jgi:ubiquinone/menaquinone biosynthesis C-methylase UbiE